MISTDDCMLYGGSINTDGYGIILANGKQYRAHRIMYENWTKSSLGELYCDHLCRVRSCINPDHIEPVDNVTNIMRGEAPSAQNARKTHCSEGHEFTGRNLRVNKKGWRICRACAAAWQKRNRARRRAMRLQQ